MSLLVVKRYQSEGLWVRGVRWQWRAFLDLVVDAYFTGPSSSLIDQCGELASEVTTDESAQIGQRATQRHDTFLLFSPTLARPREKRLCNYAQATPENHTIIRQLETIGPPESFFNIDIDFISSFTHQKRAPGCD